MTVPTNTMMLVSQAARDAELVDAAGRVTRLSGGVHGALTSLDPPAPLLLAPVTEYTLRERSKTLTTFHTRPGMDITPPLVSSRSG